MENEIRRWIDSNRGNLGIGDSEFKLIELTDGESNHVYRVSPNNDVTVKAYDLVVRTSLDISEDRISRESKILDILNKKEEIQKVPQKIYYEDSDILAQPILAQTFVGEKDINVSSMNSEQLNNFAKRLAELHSITPQSYNEVFGENEPEKASMRYELEENFRKYSREPYEEYVEKTEDVNPQVEKLFERQEELYKEMIESEGLLPWKMTHGDPSDNIRASENSIFLIDWELARPGVPRFELTYMFRHNNMSEDERREFLEIYRDYRSTSEFADEMSRKWEKFLAFNDMIWAARRKEKVKEKGDDASKYERIFEKRLQELERMWGDI